MTVQAVKRALSRGANPEDIAYDLEIPLEKVLEIGTTNP
jgi:uncharacterized protein (DUF433 family)